MIYEPHEYQTYATRYIEEHRTSAIFLDMGLGKTSISLTAINNLLFDYFDAHKILVIGPLRVSTDVWPQECRKWDHLSDLKMSVVVGSLKERMEALNTPADIYVINRENVSWLIEKSGVPFDFDTVIIDELSSFKNHDSKRFKSLMRVRPRIKRIIGLTGTPASNSLENLWAEFRILDQGIRLGRYISHFRAQYFRPGQRNGNVVYNYIPLPGAEQQIYSRINDITISMKNTDYLKMPELIVSDKVVQMDDYGWEVYNGLCKEFMTELKEGEEITASNAAVLSGKLMQVSNGFIYDDEGNATEIHSCKLDVLEEIVEEAGGKPFLLAYWFKHDLERISKKLETLGVKYEVLGSQESFDRWNKGEIAVGLISPAAASHGLNLQEGGSTIIWFGPIWSLEYYQQLNARLWRQGQKAGSVVVQHIVCESTIDEDVLKALKHKDKTQSALIAAVKAQLHK